MIKATAAIRAGFAFILSMLFEKDAKVIDKYDEKDVNERGYREQKAIGERCGIEKLDNKRNEVSPEKMKELEKKWK